MQQDKLNQINNWLVQIANGDENALILLYNELGGRMLSVALAITKDKGLAEDAVQESLIKLVRYSSSFKILDNGYGFVCKIVRNESLTIIKKYGINNRNIDEFFDIADLKQDHLLTDKKLEIKLALEKLTKGEKQIVWLKYMCGYSIREIGTELNQPKSTIMYNLKKAEEKLKNLLK